MHAVGLLTLCRCSFVQARETATVVHSGVIGIAYKDPFLLDIRLRCFCFRWRCESRIEISIAAFGLRDVQLLLLFFAVFGIKCCDLFLPSTIRQVHL